MDRLAFPGPVAQYTGYDALNAHAMSLVDESLERDQATFLVITAIKASLAVIEGSEVGVGFELEIGDIVVTEGPPLQSDQRVSLSVRPEDVELLDARPEGRNVWEARVDQKVFLGEAVDFQVKVGDRTLLSRRHPALRTKVGESIFVQLPPEKCVVLTVG